MNLAKLLKGFKGEVRLDEPLSRHTTFRIGGKVKIWAKPRDLYSLRLLLKFSAGSGLPVLLMGSGSNLLIADRRIYAIAINLSSGEFSNIVINSKNITAGAGTPLNKLIGCSSRLGLTGLEFLAGIPATLGGAIWMNASAISSNKPCSMSGIVKEVTVLTSDGRTETISREKLKFGYKRCGLSQCVIIGAKLGLGSSSEERVKKIIQDNLGHKRRTQDLSKPSAGCIFKNPSGVVSRGLAAGYLIDKAGLKGIKIGDAQISERHANFIINKGKAKAADVIKLMELTKSRVESKSSVRLEPEIKTITNNKKFPISKRAVFL